MCCKISSAFIFLFLLCFSLAIIIFLYFLTLDNFMETSSISIILKSFHNYRKPNQLFCWVSTAPVHHFTRDLAVNATWIHRCDYGVFLTSEKMPFPDINNVPLFSKILPESTQTSYNKTWLAWPYVYRNISDKYEWYFKADGDLYMIEENMRKFLSRFNPNEPHYLGLWIGKNKIQGFNSGGGYVLSNKAVKMLVEAIEAGDIICSAKDACNRGVCVPEDIAVSKCLNKLNIYPESTSDSQGRLRFLSTTMMDFYDNSTDSYKYLNNVLYDGIRGNGFDSFSPELIMIHHLTPNEVLMIDFMLYRLNKGY